MENATKGILLSGSILLVIMLISVGVLIINNSDISDEAGIMVDGYAIQTHNSKYETLQGIQPGRNVKTILNYAIQDNRNLGENERSKENKFIAVNIRSNDKEILNKFNKNSEIYRALTVRDHGVRYAENITLISQAISLEKKYNIWYSYNSKGYIWEIHIDTV